MKRITLSLLAIFVLLAGIFGVTQVAEANGSYVPPLFQITNTSLDSVQNQLTVTAGGRSGYYRYFQANCPSGPGGPFILGAYVMDDGSMSLQPMSPATGNVSVAVPEGQITQVDPGENGSVCDAQSGTPGEFSVTKTLNVSSLSNGNHTLSVTMCATPQTCRTQTATITIDRPVTPPALTGSCSASPSIANTGQEMMWTATRSGGTGSYAYSWSGTDGLSGNTQTVSKTYATQGTKNATVVITSGSQSITRNCSVTVQEQGAPQRILSVTKSGTGSGTVTGGGINCGNDCSKEIPDGSQVTLTATEDPGSEFTEWGGACSGTSSTCTVTMDANKSVTATFDTEGPIPPDTCTVTVRSEGLASRWDLTGPGGTQSQTTNTYGPVTYNNMPVGTYTLVAADFAGYNKTISPSSSAVCSAGNTLAFVINYSTQQRRLTVTIDGTGSGGVTSVPTGITCGTGPNDCQQDYAHNTQVTLSADEDPGSTFVGWSGGGCSGTSPTCTVTMNTNRTVNATFDAAGPVTQHTLWVSTVGNGTVESSPGGISCGANSTCQSDFDEGEVVTLTAEPDGTSVFDHWEGNCFGTDEVFEVTMSVERVCTAYFEIPSCGPSDEACPPGCDNPPDTDCPVPGEGDITCTVTSDTPASTNETIEFQASGGSNYTWESPASCIPTGGDGSTFSAICNTAGQKTFTVTGDSADISGTSSDQCVVEVVPQCSDGKDNADTEDTLADADDPACHTDGDPDNEETYDPGFESEVNTTPQCSDGVDNDDPEDKLADEDDPGCHTDGDPDNDESYDPTDNDETDPMVPVCSDGLDNDGDGDADWPDDPGCSSPTDDNEQDPRFDEV